MDLEKYRRVSRALAESQRQNLLHVLRLLQEAFVNVLKHGQAKRIRVSTAVGAGRVLIEVGDNGRGFDATRSTRCRGLHNMGKRAKAMGGEWHIVPGEVGTTLSLSLSLPIG